MNSSKQIQVCNEPPVPSGFPTFITLLNEYKSWCDLAPKWRIISHEEQQKRSEHFSLVFINMFNSEQDNKNPRWDLAEKDFHHIIECGHINLKLPRGECYYTSFNSLFPLNPPIFIYCIRDPVNIYKSLLSMPWGKSSSPSIYLKKLEHSVNAALSIQEKNQLITIDIDSLSIDSSQVRERHISKLFMILGLEINQEIKSFIEQWPSINRASTQIKHPDLELSIEHRKWLYSFEKKFLNSRLEQKINELKQQSPILTTIK